MPFRTLTSANACGANPVIVAGYIELLGQPVEKNGRGYSMPSVKQHLAAIRMLFDYLVYRFIKVYPHLR